MPTDVSEKVSPFDRFAEDASTFASRAWFFTLCVLLIVVWAPSFFIIGDVDTWQLIINTATTIITFLLVALLQNSQRRSDEATQHKLNAMAEGLASMMSFMAQDQADGKVLHHDLLELRRAVGLETHESA